mmetsp:Transcript_23233/g.54787  ORF Transcript_23233/g.54787 Transcript_23233/m.54787 type:complete len:347 (+) Transcript_23233:271-1311(+)
MMREERQCPSRGSEDSAPPHDEDVDPAPITVTFEEIHSSAGDADVLIEAGRKIRREDVQRVFEKSTTTGVRVSQDQIERIRAIHHKISEGARMNFNYCSLLVIASVVAGLGLAVDSSATVVSSMLLSPIMGPVIGMSYGVIIWDVPLIKRSAIIECVSILLCLVFGAIIGLCTMWTDLVQSWPTSEMMSRGTRETFLCGIPIAFFSGLGVAMSVLDDQTGSLVGAAISASLLPPAVNCGMLLVVAAVKKEDFELFNFAPTDENENYSNPSRYHVQMGIMSLFLTLVNVVMVMVGAILMMRMKEVLPLEKKVFWSDLKIARRIYTGRAVDSITGDPLSPSRVRNDVN